MIHAQLDLHIHTQNSPDGRMSLEELTAAARAKGLHAVAVCDHDRTYRGPAQCNGVLVIPGVEFSTEYGHLLGLFVPRGLTYTTLEETARTVHEAGGLLVLAHPFQHTTQEEKFLPLLPYLDGVEVWNGRANRKNPKANAMAAAFGQTYGLRPFAGSDAHVAQEIGNGVLTVETEAVTLPALRTALLAGQGTASGQNGPAVCVARSQYTKLKHTHASPARYGRWAAFAAKCVWEDIRTIKRTKEEKANVTDR